MQLYILDKNLIKSVNKDDIINWTSDSINEAIADIFKCKEVE